MGRISRQRVKLPVYIVDDTPVPRQQRRHPSRGQSTSHLVDDRRTTARHIGRVIKDRIAEENEVLAHVQFSRFRTIGMLKCRRSFEARIEDNNIDTRL